MKADYDVAFELAYYDKKTKLKNINSFNRDITQVNFKNSVYAMCSLLDIDLINRKQGREIGDALIVRTSDLLREHFGKDCVYRLLGIQFAILVDNESYDVVLSKIQDVVSSIAADGGILLYGISNGTKSKNRKDFVEWAEDTLNIAIENRSQKVALEKEENKKIAEQKVSKSDIDIVEQIYTKFDESEAKKNEPKQPTVIESAQLSEDEMLAQYMNLDM